MKTTIKTQLEKDLRSAATRLRQLGRGVAIDEMSGVIGDNSGAADEVDGSQTTTNREIVWTTRELLVARVQAQPRADLRPRRDGVTRQEATSTPS